MNRSPGTGRIRHLFTSRHGIEWDTGVRRQEMGVSAPPFDWFNLGGSVGDDPAAVRSNRGALAGALGLPPDRLLWMNQVHGTDVVEVSGPATAPLPGADAMVTAAAGIALAVLVADCVPLLAADRVARVIGVAHAGRRGAAGGIGPALIEGMVGVGGRREDMEVVVGPAICGSCYEVPARMRDEVDAFLPGSATITRDGTAGLDLRAGLIRQLRDIGVGTVSIDSRCTREDPDLFSHRGSAPTGRFAAVVMQ